MTSTDMLNLETAAKASAEEGRLPLTELPMESLEADGPGGPLESPVGYETLLRERAEELAAASREAVDFTRFQSRDSLFATAESFAAFELVPLWMEPVEFCLWLKGASEGAEGEAPAGERCEGEIPKAVEEGGQAKAGGESRPEETARALLVEQGVEAEPDERDEPTVEEVEAAALLLLPESALSDLAFKEGCECIYFYSREMMTESYAQWLFLSEEGDDMATFLFCVRQESKVYPRPMKAASLGNPPFRLNEDRVQELYEAAVAGGECADIGRTEASNGDVYYFSTDYLTSGYARYLAEWYSVGYLENP